MDIINVIIFGLLALLSGFEYYIKKTSVPIFIALVFSFLLMAAFRNTAIVPDSEAYATYIEFLNYNFETGFEFIAITVRNIFGHNYRIFFFGIAFLNTVIITLAGKLLSTVDAIKSNTNQELSIEKCPSGNQMYLSIFLALYYSFYGVYYAAIALRAGIVISLMVLAIAFAFRKKWFFCFVTVIISFLFHRSAFIVLIPVLIIVLRIRFSQKVYYFLIFIIGILFVLSNTSMFFSLQTSLIDWIVKTFSNFPKIHYISALLERDTNQSLKYMYFYAIGVFASINKTNNLRYYYLLTIYLAGLLIWLFIPVGRVADFFIVLSFLIMYMRLANINELFDRYFIYSTIILCNIVLSIRIAGTVI